MTRRFRYFLRLLKLILIPLVIFFMIVLVVFVAEAKDLRSHSDFSRLVAFIDARGINKVLDVFYLPYQFRKRQLEIFELEFDDKAKKDLERMAQLAVEADFLHDEYKKFVPGVLRYKDKEYKIEARFRGDGDIHWKFSKKSWRVRLKDGESVLGLSNFDLIVPEDRAFILEQLNSYRARKLGLATLRSEFIDLEINGHFYGPYWLVDHDYKESLEVSKRASDVNTYGGYVRFRPPREDVDDIGYWRKYSEDKVSEFDNYAEIDRLLDLLKRTGNEEFYQEIVELVDLRSIYDWQILCELAGGEHAAFQNSRLYFDITRGKFMVIPWDIEGSKSHEDFVSNILFSRIFKKPQFLREKNKLLWNYVSKAQNLEDDLAYYDDLYEKVRFSFYKDHKKRISSYRFDKDVAFWREVLVLQFNNVRERLEQVEAEARVTQEGLLKDTVRLEIVTTNYSDLLFREITFKAGEADFFRSPSLYFDSNNNGALDSDDGHIATFKFKDSAYQVHFSKILFSERDYSESYQTFLPHYVEILPTRYTFFITDVTPAFLSKTLNLNIVNSLTGEKVKIETL